MSDLILHYYFPIIEVLVLTPHAEYEAFQRASNTYTFINQYNSLK